MFHCFKQICKINSNGVYMINKICKRYGTWPGLGCQKLDASLNHFPYFRWSEMAATCTKQGSFFGRRSTTKSFLLKHGAVRQRVNRAHVFGLFNGSTEKGSKAAERSETQTASSSTIDAHDEDVLIELRDVTKSFGSKRVLEGASFKIRRGEAVGIIGPSGFALFQTGM